jgi:DNA-binding CsgD family transcriptional regulator
MLQLVDRVYAAAAAETLWDETLEDIRLAGGFEGVALVAVDRATRQATVLAAVGLGRCRESGRELAAPPVNPLHTDAVLGSKAGAVWLDQEVMAAALWADSAFATRWMRPQGLVNWACVSLTSGPGRVILLEVYGGATAGRIRARASSLLSRLAPHLIRAWRIGGIDRQPQGGGSRASGDGGTAAALAGLAPACRLRGTFGLTRAEARLALHLASGRTLGCAAEAFGVRLSTLRSQLAQVYGKTGTNRQVELVALLHRTEVASSGTRLATLERLAA